MRHFVAIGTMLIMTTATVFAQKTAAAGGGRAVDRGLRSDDSRQPDNRVPS